MSTILLHDDQSAALTKKDYVTTVKDDEKDEEKYNDIQPIYKQKVSNPLVISVCISKYDRGSNLSGVKLDKVTINSVLHEYYGYDIIENEDEYVTYDQFWDLLQQALQTLRINIKKYDGFILLLSGHGDGGKYLTSNLQAVEINDIKSYFYGNNLKGFVNKPKIIIIDACRGGSVIHPINDIKSLTTKQLFHPGQDFSVLFGNILGFVTFDDKKQGGMLIRSLDIVFRAISHNSSNMNLSKITMQMRFNVLELSGSKMIVDYHTTNTAYVEFERKSFVYGVNSSGEIWSTTCYDEKFSQIDGTLSDISVGSDGTVWGVQKNGDIFYRDFTNNTWIKVFGTLKQVSCGNKNAVWGVQDNGDIFYRDFTNNTWIKVHGALKQVSCGNEKTVWGVQDNGDIFYFDFDNNGWVKVDGKLKQVSCGDKATVWGVQDNGDIFYLDFAKNSWVKVNGVLSYIAVGKTTKEVWGVQNTGKVFYHDFDNNTWVIFPGSLSQISIK